jgi:hypothetical protein
LCGLQKALVDLLKVQVQQVSLVAGIRRYDSVYGHGLELFNAIGRVGSQALPQEQPSYVSLSSVCASRMFSDAFLSCTCAALTNYKRFLWQICRRIERREFAIDFAVHAGGLQPATRRALLGLPAANNDCSDDDEGVSEFGFTGREEADFCAAHRLYTKLRNTWVQAVRGVFSLLTE